MTLILHFRPAAMYLLLLLHITLFVSCGLPLKEGNFKGEPQCLAGQETHCLCPDGSNSRKSCTANSTWGLCICRSNLSPIDLKKVDLLPSLKKCREHSDCPAGQNCQNNLCKFQVCKNHQSCPWGQVCSVEGELGICLEPGCQKDNDCGGDNICREGKCLTAQQLLKSETFIRLSSNHVSTCGIRGDNYLWCWQEDTSLKYLNQDQIFTTIQMDNDKWLDISMGYNHTCGIKSDRTLWCWENSNLSQESGFSQKEVPVQLGDNRWKVIDSGKNHTCGIRSDSSLWCWEGKNLSHSHNLWPIKIGQGQWKFVSSGEEKSCAIHKDNILWCWKNGENQLPKSFDGNQWRQVSAGKNHLCGLKKDNSLWCWGDNRYGQVGDGTMENGQVRETPVFIGGYDWREISAGEYHTCGLKKDNRLWCWGLNRYGQIGDGTKWSRPKPINVNQQQWKQITSGGNHTCGIRSDNTIWCWGYNFYSRYGQGIQLDIKQPSGNNGD